MNKDSIVEGTEYARYSEREFTSYASRVRVISNENYLSLLRRNLSRTALAENPTYVAAHLKASLAEAYASDTTPNEVSEARNELRQAVNTATREWYDAEPLRAFQQTRSQGEGILAMALDREGNDKHLTLVPRRELRDTWTDHQVKVQQAQAQRVQNELLGLESRARKSRERTAIYEAVAAAFTQAGVTPPYLSSYAGELSLTFAQAAVLLGVSLGQEVPA